MNREHEELNFSPGVIVDYISRLTHKQAKKKQKNSFNVNYGDNRFKK